MWTSDAKSYYGLVTNTAGNVVRVDLIIESNDNLVCPLDRELKYIETDCDLEWLVWRFYRLPKRNVSGKWCIAWIENAYTGIKFAFAIIKDSVNR